MNGEDFFIYKLTITPSFKKFFETFGRESTDHTVPNFFINHPIEILHGTSRIEHKPVPQKRHYPPLHKNQPEAPRHGHPLQKPNRRKNEKLNYLPRLFQLHFQHLLIDPQRRLRAILRSRNRGNLHPPRGLPTLPRKTGGPNHYLQLPADPFPTPNRAPPNQKQKSLP